MLEPELPHSGRSKRGCLGGEGLRAGSHGLPVPTLALVLPRVFLTVSSHLSSRVSTSSSAHLRYRCLFASTISIFSRRSSEYATMSALSGSSSGVSSSN